MYHSSLVAHQDVNEYVVEYYLNAPARLLEQSIFDGDGYGPDGNIPRAWLASLKLILNISYPYMNLSLAFYHNQS